MRLSAFVLPLCAAIAAPAAACQHAVGIPVAACPTCQAAVSAVSVGQVATTTTVAIPMTTTVTVPTTVAVPLYTQSATVSLPVATAEYGVGAVGIPTASATSVVGGAYGVGNVGVVGGSCGVGNVGVVGIPVGVQRGVGIVGGRGRFRSKAVSKVKIRGRG